MTNTTLFDAESEPAKCRLLRAVEHQLHESEIGFSLDKARLYGVTVNLSSMMDDHEETFRLCFLDAHQDVYELLERPSSTVARVFDAAILVTTGWATPIDPESGGERRRVRLTVLVSNDGVASGLRFQDDECEVLVDEGSATGALNDAVLTFWFGGPNASSALPGLGADNSEG